MGGPPIQFKDDERKKQMKTSMAWRISVLILFTLVARLTTPPTLCAENTNKITRSDTTGEVLFMPVSLFPKPHPVLGDGFDLTHFTVLPNCALTTREEMPQDVGLTQSFSLEAHSANDVFFSTDSVTLAARARYLFASGGVNATVKSGQQRNFTDLSVALKLLVEGPSTRIKGGPYIQKKLAPVLGTQGFLRDYGTHAVVARLGHSSVTFEYDTSGLSQNELKEFSAQIQGSVDVPIASGSVSGGTSSVVKELLDKRAAYVGFKTEGFADIQGLPTTPPTANTVYQWATDLLNAMSGPNVTRKPVDDVYMLMPYDRIPIEGGISSQQSEAYATTLQVAQLFQLAQHYSILLPLVDDMKKNPLAYSYVKEEDRQKIVAQEQVIEGFYKRLKEQLQKINTKHANIQIPDEPPELQHLPWPQPTLQFGPWYPCIDKGTTEDPCSIQFTITGGKFRWLKVRALKGSNVPPHYVARAPLDMRDTKYQQGDPTNRDLYISQPPTDDSVVGYVALGAVDHSSHPKEFYEGPFLIQVLADDKETVVLESTLPTVGSNL
jgi:hypothetical protein